MRNLINLVYDSFYKIWNSPILIRLSLILLFASFISKIFIYATTNSTISPELGELLSTISLFQLAVLTSSSAICLIYFSTRKEFIDFIVACSILLVSSTIFIGLYDFLPCLWKHTDSLDDHIHPHTISYILKQSILCPSYSLRSWFILLFFSGTGFVTFFISLKIKSGLKKKLSLKINP